MFKKILISSILVLFALQNDVRTYDNLLSTHIASNPIKFVLTMGAAVGFSTWCYNQVVMWHVAQQAKKQQAQMALQPRPQQIAILKIHGDIIEINTVARWVEYIVKAKEDVNIKGVLLSIEATGGYVGLSSLLYHEIKQLAQIKPVVTFCASFSLSAGYETACASTYIIATELAAIGSIGVRANIIKFKDDDIKGTLDYEKGNLNHFVLSAGKYKTIFDPHDARIEEACAYKQEMLNKEYDLFCRNVASARNLNLDEREQWADGKIFLGYEALELGLIDQIGSFSDALAKLEELVRERNPEITGTFERVYA